MARKNLAALDTHRPSAAQTALANRFNHSRVVPFHAPVTKLAQNPFNYREPDDPEVQEVAESITHIGQLQTAVVVTRDTFIEAYPEGEPHLPETIEWVTIMGNRRLAATALAGKPTLEVVLATSVDTAADIEDAILHENIHRKNLSPLKEGELFRRKMQREGLSARELATRIGKSHTYINQRLALDNLIPEFQHLLATGQLGMQRARDLASQSPQHQHQQLQLWPMLGNLI